MNKFKLNSKEYTIFITCKGGKTYNLLIYDNIFEAKQKLYEMINLEKERSRPYYVYNDFYENEYPASLNCKIFCLKERKISKWEKCSGNKILENTKGNKIHKNPNRKIYSLIMI